MSNYHPPLLHRSAHFSTIVPNRLRPVGTVAFDRQRVETDDGDFIDLDFSSIESNVGVVLLHGLEGSSDSRYIKALIKQCNSAGWDGIAMNFRSCSGAPNRVISSYHSGISSDLEIVLKKLRNQYDRLYIVGFSLGGNVCLKWAGETDSASNTNVHGVIGISVPCDLSGSGETLAKGENFIYLHRFLTQLKNKALAKLDRFPEANLSRDRIENAKTFWEFDDAYTAPVHGFDSADDYYTKCSSRQFIPSIKVQTLIINAKNDSFLNEACYPIDEAANNDYVTLLTPSFGGHVGFASNHRMNRPFWHETKIIAFIQSIEKSFL